MWASQRQQGYSFVQLMISLAVGGLAISFAIIYMAQTAKKLNQSVALTDAERQMGQAQMLIQEDFPNNVFTPICSTAKLKRPDVAPVAGEYYAWWREPFTTFDENDVFDNFHYFRYFDGRNRNAQARLLEDNDAVFLEFVLQDPNFIPGPDLDPTTSNDAFMYHALSRIHYLTVYDSSCRHLVKRKANASPSSTPVVCSHNGNLKCVRLEIEKPAGFDDRNSEFTGKTFELALLEKVSLEVDTTGPVPTLIQQVDDRVTTNKVLVPGISKFHVYLGGFLDEFGGKNKDKYYVALDADRKGKPFRSVRDEAYLADFAQNGGTKLAVTPPLAKWARFEFQVGSGESAASWSFATALTLRGLEEVLEVAGAVPPACSRVSKARCKAECSAFFTDPNPNGDFFSEYGQHDGPLCQCGSRNTQDEWVHPNVGAGNNSLYPHWTAADITQKARLNACARWSNCGFNTGAPSWINGKHPACQLVSQCLQPRDSLFNKDNANPFVDAEIVRAIVNPLDANDRSRLRCDWVGPNWQGAHAICFKLAQDYFGGSQASIPSSWDRDNNPWKEKCRCLIENDGPGIEYGSVGYNSSRNPNYDTIRLDFHAIDWDSLCGISTTSCASYNSEDNSYNITTDPNPAWSRDDQRLTEDEAILCECRKRARADYSAANGGQSADQEGHAGFYLGRHDKTAYQDRISIWANWDGNPDPIVGAPAAGQCIGMPNAAPRNYCFSPVSAQIAAVKVKDGNTTRTISNASCARAQCRTGHAASQSAHHPTPGCCLEEGNTTAAGAEIPFVDWDTVVEGIADPTVRAQMLNNPYRYFCRSRCGRYGGAFDHQADIIRNRLIAVLQTSATPLNSVGRCVILNAQGNPAVPNNVGLPPGF